MIFQLTIEQSMNVIRWQNLSQGHSVVLWRLWLLVVPDGPTKGQGHLLNCSGQLKNDKICVSYVAKGQQHSADLVDFCQKAILWTFLFQQVFVINPSDGNQITLTSMYSHNLLWWSGLHHQAIIFGFYWGRIIKVCQKYCDSLFLFTRYMRNWTICSVRLQNVNISKHTS